MYEDSYFDLDKFPTARNEKVLLQIKDVLLPIQANVEVLFDEKLNQRTMNVDIGDKKVQIIQREGFRKVRVLLPTPGELYESLEVKDMIHLDENSVIPPLILTQLVVRFAGVNGMNMYLDNQSMLQGTSSYRQFSFVESEEKLTFEIATESDTLDLRDLPQKARKLAFTILAQLEQLAYEQEEYDDNTPD